MSASPADPYVVLGLPPEATQEQIRHAYRAMLRRNHPDTRDSSAAPPASAGQTAGAGSDDALQQAVAAYALLSDPRRRADYDRRIAPPRAARPAPTVPSARWSSPGAPPPIQAGPVRWHQRTS
jgi:curved DNA-binding protein CbpA